MFETETVNVLQQASLSVLMGYAHVMFLNLRFAASAATNRNIHELNAFIIINHR